MIQLTALLFLSLASSGDHAALHPADANLYLEVPNVPAALEAYRQAPLVRLLQDEEIGALARRLGGLPEDFDLWEGLQDQIAEMTDPGVLLALRNLADIGGELRSASVAFTGLTGSDALALELEIDPAALLRHIGVQVVLEFSDAVAPARLVGMLGLGLPPAPDAEGPGELELLGESRTIQRFSLPNAPYLPPIWTVTADRLLILGLGASSPTELAARAAGGPSFLARAGELRGAERFSTPSGATVYESTWWLPTPPFYADLLEQETPEAAGEIAGALLGNFMPFEPTVMRSRLQLREGSFVSESFERRAAAASTATPPLFGSTPLAAGALERAAPEAVWVWATSMSRDALRGAATRLVEMVVAGDPEEGDFGQGLPPEVAAKLGPMLDGVLASFGTDLVVYMLPIAGLKIPQIHAVLGLENAGAFEQNLAALAKFVEEQAGGMVSLDTRPYRRQPVVTLKPNLGGMGIPPMISFDLTVGIVGDRAVVGLSAMDVKKEMRRLLGEEAGTHAVAREGKAPKGTTSMHWLDWGALVGGIYDSARALAALVPDASMLPVDVTQLPESKVFTRFFRPTTAWSRGGEDGIYSYSESSFGPEFLITALAAGLTFGAVSSSASEEFVFVEGLEPAEAASGDTLSALQEVKLAVVLYRSERGELPAAIEDLLRPSEAFPSGYLRRGSVPVDEWGRAPRYARTEGGQGFLVWSLGPDGEDAEGAGDDVVAP